MRIIKRLKQWFCKHEVTSCQIEDNYVAPVNDGDLIMVIVCSKICKDCNKNIESTFGYDIQRKKKEVNDEL
jgi:hypothetical protein